MTVREAQARPFRLTLRLPHNGSNLLQRERSGLLIVLFDDEGHVGRGEATPLVGFGTEQVSLTTALLAEICAKLAGASLPARPDDVDRLLANFPQLTQAPAARCGLELALLDLAAQRARQPVSEFLSDSARSHVPVNALLSASEPDALAAQAYSAVEQGFRVVKVKVGRRALSEDAKRLIAVRRTVGGEVKIRIDANGGWTEAEATTALRGLSPLNLELCEQPVPAPKDDALRRLRWVVDCPIAADESVSQPGASDRLLEGEDGPAADVLVLKPMVLGGLLPSLRLARRAEEVGVGCYVTSSLDGVVARLGAAHLAAALPRADWASGLAVGHLFEEDTGLDPCPPLHGQIELPGAPGLGLSANWGQA